jgi:uncharacterized protein YrrD
MRLAKDIINKPIISLHEKCEIGRVEDLYLDSALKRVVALYLGPGGSFGRRDTLIKFESVAIVGPDTVLVKEKDCVLDDELTADVAGNVRRDDLEGRQVDSADGTKIGFIDDVILDAKADIVGFSLSRVYVNGFIAENLTISREAVVDIGQKDGVMTVDLKQAKQSNFRVGRVGAFSTSTVTATKPDDQR